MSEEERREGPPEDLGDRIRDQVEQGLPGGLRHSMRHSMRHGLGSWSFSFDTDADEDRTEASDVEERRFTVGGMPKVQVANVSGETRVTLGDPGEVSVRARKYVRGWSEERSRRLLENVEVRIEQRDDEILIEPRLFQQERGWLDLFRGGRVRVDLDVRVPRETHLLARTVSGELSVAGLRGTIDLQSVSGDVEVSDVQGPMRLRTVSGDATVTAYAGRLDANSTSGDIEIERSRIRTPEVVTVSGDVGLDAVFLAGNAGEARIRTVSGDVDLALGEASADIDFGTVSGDADVEIAARIEKTGRRDRRIVIGSGGPQLRVKTVSGDLTVRAARGAPAEPDAPSADATPMAPAPAASEASPTQPDARAILERLARGEIDVDQAAAALDARKAT